MTIKNYIGIDPSITSCGICYQQYIDDELTCELIFIVTPKVTKSDLKESDKHSFMQYRVYEKVSDNTDKYSKELSKTISINNECNVIDEIFDELGIGIDDTVIVMEGMSYESKHTSSLADLSGLNYLIRHHIIKRDNVQLYVVPPTEIKKFASGFGGAKKSIMIDMFKGKHKNLNLSKMDDIADAYFMCRFAKFLKNKKSK